IAKLAREEWKNMTKTQKALYEIVAKQNKKYTQEIKVCVPSSDVFVQFLMKVFVVGAWVILVSM
ncbi:high mobility group B protein 13, partial [Tanacetum coccineum]